MKIARILVWVVWLMSSSCFASEPGLYIKAGNKEITYTRSQLLSRPDVSTLSTSSDPTLHGKTMKYTVVPAAALFKGIDIPADAEIQFDALDGFSAPIAKALLLNTATDAAIAYVAIEKPGETWPAINPGVDDRTSAPFYLVWGNPEKSRISTELWVMQLAGFTITESFQKLYPDVMPKNISDNDPVMQGFKVFKTNCFSCHTMNKQGNGKLAPDLNVPYNPTEYLPEKYLRIFIRNPQNLRHWPGDRMNAFPAAVINDEELNHLIAYLRYMKEHKVK